MSTKFKNEVKKEGCVEKYFRRRNEKKAAKQVQAGQKRKNWLLRILGW